MMTERGRRPLPDTPQASAVWKRVGAQTLAEVKLVVRRGESLLFTLILPLLLLIFFSKVDVLPYSDDRPAVFHLMPVILALAIISTSFVSLAIATGYDRKFKVLKRLGLTPLGRSGLIGAKIAAILAIEVTQVLSLVSVGAGFLGWRFSGNVLVLAAFLFLGTAAFAGLGLLMAGLLRAEGTLALANGLYVVFVLFGGIAVPLAKLPPAIGTAGQALPSAALASGLSSALGEGNLPGGALLVLALWAVVGISAAARTFRWE